MLTRFNNNININCKFFKFENKIESKLCQTKNIKTQSIKIQSIKIQTIKQSKTKL